MHHYRGLKFFPKMQNLPPLLMRQKTRRYCRQFSLQSKKQEARTMPRQSQDNKTLSASMSGQGQKNAEICKNMPGNTDGTCQKILIFPAAPAGDCHKVFPLSKHRQDARAPQYFLHT